MGAPFDFHTCCHVAVSSSADQTSPPSLAPRPTFGCLVELSVFEHALVGAQPGVGRKHRLPLHVVLRWQLVQLHGKLVKTKKLFRGARHGRRVLPDNFLCLFANELAHAGVGRGQGTSEGAQGPGKASAGACSARKARRPALTLSFHLPPNDSTGFFGCAARMTLPLTSNFFFLLKTLYCKKSTCGGDGGR